MGRFHGRTHETVTSASRPDGGSMPGRRHAAGRTWTARRIAGLGAVAVLGIALHTSARPAAIGGPRAGGRMLSGSAARLAYPQRVVPGPGVGGGTAHGNSGSTGPVGAGASSGSGRSARSARQASAFRQIFLPDLLIVTPKGLTGGQLARLRKIPGLRGMITFDGAQITAGGRPVSVIGVDPATFRSWVPLRTASDQAFWAALSNGDFVASSAASSSLQLRPGAFYRLVGGSAQVVRFGLAAKLGISGVDLLVNKATSQRLGLVRQVAGLISAPGVSLPRLISRVSAALGRAGKVEPLRSQLPVTAAPAGGKPANYLELFKASAANFCPGLSWTVLAAIGQIESADGTNVGPSSAGALGPMQFLPSTWAQWGVDAFGETGPPNVLDPYDAVPSAARLLCADGAAAGGRSLYNAIFDYNHADWYVNEVLALAAQYATAYR
jgi:Transglycosylase SLT domain